MNPPIPGLQNKPTLDARTILLARHPDGRGVLLLRRSPHKKLFPNLITGIGGAVEFLQNEANDLSKALLREVREETHIQPQHLSSLQLLLATLESRNNTLVLLLWFTANLLCLPDLSTPEGTLAFYDPDHLPLDQMIPSARFAIPKVLSYPNADSTLHTELIP